MLGRQISYSVLTTSESLIKYYFTLYNSIIGSTTRCVCVYFSITCQPYDLSTLRRRVPSAAYCILFTTLYYYYAFTVYNILSVSYLRTPIRPRTPCNNLQPHEYNNIII